MKETKLKIMKIAEKMMRSGGYNGFSFREIAASVGIKSASVHHHFAKKEDLASAVMHHYGENFFTLLGEPSIKNTSTQKLITTYCNLFLKSFEATGRSCLCGVLSNEAEQLPPIVREKVTAFVDQNITWLITALGADPKSQKLAQLIYCTLEGSIGVAAVEQDSKKLKQNIHTLLHLLAFD